MSCQWFPTGVWLSFGTGPLFFPWELFCRIFSIPWPCPLMLISLASLVIMKKQTVSLGPEGDLLIAEGRRWLKKEIAKIKLKGPALIQLAYSGSQSRMRDVASQRGKEKEMQFVFWRKSQEQQFLSNTVIFLVAHECSGNGYWGKPQSSVQASKCSTCEIRQKRHSHPPHPHSQTSII